MRQGVPWSLFSVKLALDETVSADLEVEASTGNEDEILICEDQLISDAPEIWEGSKFWEVDGAESVKLSILEK